ncbi:hypothetical protein Hte_010200 [Hypoxylon texense]
MPQGAEDEDSLWKVLQNRENLMTEWPSSRVNLDAFYDRSPGVSNKLYSRGAHFLKDDPACFDAPFFSITTKEAMAMDPQQRRVLEASYHAFENAGMVTKDLKGSRTAVFGASMTDDYSRMQSKDPDSVVQMAATGTAASILPNRISWYFDLRGPSVHVDTACSSSLVALDLACQSLQTGSASTALITGVSLILGPEGSLMLSHQNFLSPDSVCYSFDDRANGYARGEGVVALVIKPVQDAIRDGDMIRAVIRSTGSNQDGRTPGLTQPSTDAQEALIRDVYRKAGLDFTQTRYVEAHGTGTAVGDPIELKAIGNVFGSIRTPQQPLYVGSIKSNIGHLEGCSGLASIVKSIMILERGMIAPNALFEKLNPAVSKESHFIKIPTKTIAWPTQELRRISVNSFGFGGTNAHVILDDAYHYLRLRRQSGNHLTLPSFGSLNGHSGLNGVNGTDGIKRPNGTTSPKLFSSVATRDEHRLNSQFSRFQILALTSPDVKALGRVTQGYQTYYSSKISSSLDYVSRCRRLAYTLAARRNHMTWRSFAIVDTGSTTVAETLDTAHPIRASIETGAAYIFTGQGAQYVSMGFDLINYPIFKEVLQRIDNIYRSLGCRWSIFEELVNGEHIDRPEYSQPLCTAIQIALVELLASFNIAPKVVIGHSSGEIAAAYATGALSLESACKVSYVRGQLAGKLKVDTALVSPGSMMSVNIPASQVQGYFSKLDTPAYTKSIHVACENSPLNSTLSGPEELIDSLKSQLDHDNIFAQKLRTGVAYHSPAMQAIASEYLTMMGSLEPSDDGDLDVIHISTVTGAIIPLDSLREPKYWVDNLVSAVKFSDAIQTLAQGLPSTVGPITDFIEIGPHTTLRRPIRDSMGDMNEIRYNNVLNRTRSPLLGITELVGRLFCYGHPVSITAVNQLAGTDGLVPLLADCPEYPFDHSQQFWAESRLSRDYRLREGGHDDLLGWRFQDWNPLAPRWRNFLSVETAPWTGDHVVSGTVVLPATAMLVMALEAVKQASAANRQISGFHIKQADFINAMVVGQSFLERTETMVHLTPLKRSYEKEPLWYQVKIFAYSNDQWRECFHATMQVQFQEEDHQVDGGLEKRLADAQLALKREKFMRICTNSVDSGDFYEYCMSHGLNYGDYFQLLQDIKWDGTDTAVARMDIDAEKYRITSMVHPAILDATLQLLLAQVSKGLSRSTNTFVPHQITDAWVSYSGWNQPQSSSLHVLTRGREKAGAQGLQGTIQVVADDDCPLFTINKIDMAAIAGGVSANVAEERLLYNIEWKPQLSMVSPEQLGILLGSQNPPSTDEEALGTFRCKLNPVLRCILRKTYRELSWRNMDRVPKHLRKYVEWMEQYIELDLAIEANEEPSDEEVEAELQALEGIIPSWELILVVARNLKAILSGEIDIFQLTFDTGLAKKFYDWVFGNPDDSQFRYLLELISHENPSIRILEVGAGTGAWSDLLLSTLQEFETRSGRSSFSHYTYTDISPGFFDKAMEKFAKYTSRMDFRALNIEREPAEQGFELHSYDVVVAGNVLHATADLPRAIGNVRKLLKPGGRLILSELTVPNDVAMNMTFGLFPGWWNFTDPWRDHVPIIEESRWHEILKCNGFSGVDLVLKDYKNKDCHLTSVMLSRAELPAPVIPNREVVFVVDPQSTYQTSVAKVFGAKLRGSAAYRTTTMSLHGTQSICLGDDDIVISLVELGDPLFSTLSSDTFHALKQLIKSAKNLLWVTLTDISDPTYPFHHLTTGLFRCMRLEAIEKHIVQLEVEARYDAHLCIGFISKVFAASFESGSPELQYCVRKGLLTTGRLIEEISLDQEMRSLIHPQEKNEPWMPGPPLKLALGTQGVLDTLRFEEDTAYKKELAPGEIEIEAKAWGLNFKDLFVALGRLEDDGLGCDCAGVVTRIGASPDESGIRPGDRVCLVYSGCFRTYIQMPASAVNKIPDSLSFEEAVSVICPGATTYHALMNVARLSKGDKVLIHSASGGTGQMAVQIAQMVGAEIFVTVGYDEKKELLMNHFGIAEDHIFYSRNTNFADGIRRMTDGYGVDVVLNSLSGDGLRASWDCIAPYGRFIEIGKTDIVANESMPMANFLKNVSYCAVDFNHITQTKGSLAIELQQKVLDLVTSGDIQTPYPLHRYSVSETEAAFRFFQSGKNTGRIIITPKPEDIVPKYITHRSEWEFDRNASYLIAGGLGGLGRAIILWMATKGARNLIIPSRSGVSSQAASDVIAKLREKGVNIATPVCDVSSASSLSAALAACADDMPPVRGCINAAMVLQDALLENMTHAQWELTIRSKAHTSWNLHQLFPQLDFFILLSSLAGTTGPVAQSNYAAGCTFQDALARHRAAAGEKAVSLDVGWMGDVGIVAENRLYEQYRRVAGDMQRIRADQLLAVLDACCDPSPSRRAPPPEHGSQLLIGMMTPAHRVARGLAPTPLMEQPLYWGFSRVAGDGRARGNAAGDDAKNPAVLFRSARTVEGRTAAVVNALATRVARALSVPVDHVAPEKPLSEYGVDSLMAVELRNWIDKDFQANVAVFDIMGNTSIASIGSIVAARSKIELVE